MGRKLLSLVLTVAVVMGAMISIGVATQLAGNPTASASECYMNGPDACALTQTPGGGPNSFPNAGAGQTVTATAQWSQGAPGTPLAACPLQSEQEGTTFINSPGTYVWCGFWVLGMFPDGQLAESDMVDWWITGWTGWTSPETSTVTACVGNGTSRNPEYGCTAHATFGGAPTAAITITFTSFLGQPVNNPDWVSTGAPSPATLYFQNTDGDIVADGSGGQLVSTTGYAGAIPAGADTSPSSQERIVWLSATGSNAGQCQSRANGAINTFGDLGPYPNNPAPCTLFESPEAQTTASYSLTMPSPCGSPYYLQPFLIEWDATGGHTGMGAGYTFQLAAGNAYTGTSSCGPGGAMSISASPTSLPTGHYTTLTVSAALGTGLHAGDTLSLFPSTVSASPYNQNGNATTTTCVLTTAGTCTTSGQVGGPLPTSTDATAEAVYFVAFDGSSWQESTNAAQVIFTSASAGSMSISASPSTLGVGQSTTLTISSTLGSSVKSGDTVTIQSSLSQGVNSQSSSATTASCVLSAAGSCQATSSDSQVQTAYFFGKDGTTPTSNQAPVSWTSAPASSSISLSASPDTLITPAGGTIQLVAQAQNLTRDDYIQIYAADASGNPVGTALVTCGLIYNISSCSGSTTPAASAFPGVARYVAALEGNPSLTNAVLSYPAPVTLYAPTLQASPTSLATGPTSLTGRAFAQHAGCVANLQESGSSAGPFVTFAATPMPRPLTGVNYVGDSDLGTYVDRYGGIGTSVDANNTAPPNLINAPTPMAVNPTTGVVYVGHNYYKDNTAGGLNYVEGITVANSAPTTPMLYSQVTTALAVNPSTNYLYAGADNGYVEVSNISNRNTNFQVDPDGSSPVAAIAVNSATNRLYVATGQNISVYDATTMSLLAKEGQGAVALAVNQTTNTVYASTSGGQFVWVINGATNTSTTSISLYGNGTNAIFASTLAVNPSTNTIYAGGVGGTAVINGSTNTVTTRLAAIVPLVITVDPSTNLVYFMTSSSTATAGNIGTVSVMDGSSNSIVQAYAAGYALSMALDPTHGFVYLASVGYGLTMLNTSPLAGSFTSFQSGTLYFELTETCGAVTGNSNVVAVTWSIPPPIPVFPTAFRAPDLAAPAATLTSLRDAARPAGQALHAPSHGTQGHR